MFCEQAAKERLGEKERETLPKGLGNKVREIIPKKHKIQQKSHTFVYSLSL